MAEPLARTMQTEPRMTDRSGAQDAPAGTQPTTAPGGGVSVVVPVYKSTTTLAELARRIREVLTARGVPYEVILVDDGSGGGTWPAIRSLARQDPAVVGLRLGRNVGQHNALVAGVRRARYPVAVTLDDDLQNPPEEIPALLDALVPGVDVVYGEPREVAQRKWRATSSVVARGVMSSALGAENASRISSFRAFRTQLRDAFVGDLGPSVSLDALLSWGTSSFTSVAVDHHPRAEGESNYGFRKLVRYAVDTATGYSALPLKVATSLGLATAAFGLVVLVWVVARVLVGGVAVPGFAFLASIVSIFAGVQLIAIGVIGEYLARMHFRIMRKPTYLVAERTDEAGTP